MKSLVWSLAPTGGVGVFVAEELRKREVAARPFLRDVAPALQMHGEADDAAEMPALRILLRAS